MNTAQQLEQTVKDLKGINAAVDRLIADRDRLAGENAALREALADVLDIAAGDYHLRQSFKANFDAARVLLDAKQPHQTRGCLVAAKGLDDRCAPGDCPTPDECLNQNFSQK